MTNRKFQINDRVVKIGRGHVVQGVVYEVTRILPKNHYEIKATVDYDDAWASATSAQKADVLMSRILAGSGIDSIFVACRRDLVDAVEAIADGRLDTIFPPEYPTHAA